MNSIPEPRFVCDVMLGGLARWLRAAGYDTAWQERIEDSDLVRLAATDQRVLLSSDTGIFRIGIVRDGDVPALWIPHGLSTVEQLSFVLRELGLPLREARCMACGGELADVDKEQVRGRVPQRSWQWQDRFWECRRCAQVFWQGTHWRRIAEQLQQIEQTVRAGEADQLPLTEAQKQDLQRRLANHEANPRAGSSWEEVKESLRRLS